MEAIIEIFTALFSGGDVLAALEGIDFTSIITYFVQLIIGQI